MTLQQKLLTLSGVPAHGHMRCYFTNHHHLALLLPSALSDKGGFKLETSKDPGIVHEMRINHSINVAGS